ncbi:MAG: hypothetical protein IAF08_03640 [Rhizobacter sp.]|nr:hypothetical protein [Chlorobiales bacterium]
MEMGCTQRYHWLIAELEESLKASDTTLDAAAQTDALRNSLQRFFPDGALFDCESEGKDLRPVDGCVLYICAWCKKPMRVRRNHENKGMTSYGICQECKTVSLNAHFRRL